MKRTYALTRVPDHSELRRALSLMSRATQERVAAAVLRDNNIDLPTVLKNEDPETLTTVQRRAVAQAMHDRGAAFMLSSHSAA